ncbi:MAG: hypothetical protein ACK4ND_19410 [Cytophagaceae bacterium]
MSGKNLKSLLIAISLVLFCLPASLAQTKRELIKLEIGAKDNFENKRFKESKAMYTILDSLKPGNALFIYPLIVSSIAVNDYESLLPFVEKGFKVKDQMPSDFLLYAAKAYHLNYKFDEAEQYYLEYKKHALNARKPDPVLISTLNRDIKMCQNARELVANPLDIQIKNMGSSINSPYADYGPVISADESTIIFTSNRPNSTTVFLTDEEYEYLDDIYISHKTDTGWSEPHNMGPNINSKNHDAGIALSADGQKLLIYRSEKTKIMSFPTGDIYISELQGDAWSKAEKLPADINTKNWEPSASFSSDERTLYFTSNRKGGIGGTDIYSVKKLPTGEWAVPQNLGDKINTPFDEDSPFMHPDGKTLYFSSNGHKSMGGYDIFYSQFNAETNEWSEPKNVGYPINTPSDDIYFSWSADGTTAYFSSYRKDSYGDVDIYYANVFQETSPVLLMKGFVIDSISQAPVQATIKVTDKNTNELVGIFNSNSSTGKFIIILNNGSYNVSIQSENYEFCVDDLDLTDLTEYREIDRNIKLCPKKE